MTKEKNGLDNPTTPRQNKDSQQLKCLLRRLKPKKELDWGTSVGKEKN